MHGAAYMKGIVDFGGGLQVGEFVCRWIGAQGVHGVCRVVSLGILVSVVGVLGIAGSSWYELLLAEVSKVYM